MDKIFEITAKEVNCTGKKMSVQGLYITGRFPSIIMRMQMF